MEWVLYLPRGTLDVFLVIWQPFLKLEMIGDIVGINFLCLQIHGLDLCLLSDGYHFNLYWNRNVLESLELCRHKKYVQRDETRNEY